MRGIESCNSGRKLPDTGYFVDRLLNLLSALENPVWFQSLDIFDSGRVGYDPEGNRLAAMSTDCRLLTFNMLLSNPIPVEGSIASGFVHRVSGRVLAEAIQ
jgi:hypothetical protein